MPRAWTLTVGRGGGSKPAGTLWTLTRLSFPPLLSSLHWERLCSEARGQQWTQPDAPPHSLSFRVWKTVPRALSSLLLPRLAGVQEGPHTLPRGWVWGLMGKNVKLDTVLEVMGLSEGPERDRGERVCGKCRAAAAGHGAEGVERCRYCSGSLSVQSEVVSNALINF